MRPETPDVSVIIVNFNGRTYLLETLASLLPGLEGIPSEVIVVDNASDDGSAAAVRQAFSAVSVVELPENIGFGGANNRGVEQASGEYLVFLNSDTSIPEGAVGRLLDIINVMDRIAYPCVLRDGAVGIVHFTCSIRKYHVFKQRPRLDRPEDIRFLLFGEVNHLGITSTFEVEYGVFRCPSMLIITDEFPVRICRSCGFTRS